MPVEGSWHDFPLVRVYSREWLSEGCREKSSRVIAEKLRRWFEVVAGIDS